MYSQNPKAKRIEFRCPDTSCNPYLAFSAMMMAAIDGIRTRSIPAIRSTRTLRPPAGRSRRSADDPGSLDEALTALNATTTSS